MVYRDILCVPYSGARVPQLAGVRRIMSPNIRPLPRQVVASVPPWRAAIRQQGLDFRISCYQ